MYVIFVLLQILPTQSEGRLLDDCEQAVVNVSNYSERQNPQAEVSSCNL